MQVSTLVALINEWAAAEEELAKFKRDVTTPLYNKIEELEAKIVVALEQEGMSNFRTPDFLVSKVIKYAVPTLKTREEKEAYLTWLKDRAPDTYWAQVNVLSQTLNAYVNEQTEIAKANKDLNFKIPGVKPPEAKTHLQRRKAK